MRMHPLLAGACVALASAAAGAQTLKPGLWEIDNSGAGMDQAMAQMQQQLANMPPEQRKQMEAMMAQRGMRVGGHGMAVRVCMTREMVERHEMPVREGCTTTKNERTGNTVRIAFRCTNPPSSGEGEFTFVNPESYRSRIAVTSTAEGRSEAMTMESSGKWLGADCGSIKPPVTR
jgi:hypothetical protein